MGGISDCLCSKAEYPCFRFRWWGEFGVLLFTGEGVSGMMMMMDDDYHIGRKCMRDIEIPKKEDDDCAPD